MFEDSLLASRMGTVATERRWTWMVSVALQSGVAATVILLTAFHPEILPLRVDPPKVLMPLMPKAPVRVETRQTEASSSSPMAPVVTQIAAERSLLPSLHPSPDDVPPSFDPMASGPRMADASVLGSASGPVNGHGPAVSVRPEPKAGPLHVSSGVSEGMLIAPIRPVYPAIAKAARVQGSVVVEAIISKVGTIESLHVVSGPEMLQHAAIDAIREARYRPYKLNGEAVEVETRITVNFLMGG
ncbi:MAG TPA: TonB family protein [Edaphobacter sp.]|jgi:protein TonB|nr:TonB family protein [Edaphobacter sp.]